jgi:RNA polymerase sigma factor (sigma-70 family)
LNVVTPKETLPWAKRIFLPCGNRTFQWWSDRAHRWRRFGWSDVVNHTLLEAYRDLAKLQVLDEADRNRRLRRMLLNNLLERIEHERAEMRDYRREASLDEALAGSSCNLQKWLAADTAGPEGRADADERGALLASALSQLPEREREALILQKYHGWSLAQIAEHLGCTAGAVAGLHARGLKRRAYPGGGSEAVAPTAA